MKHVAKGVYPYNTGKVNIGAMYIPKKPHYCTEAELFWQGILLRQESVWVKRLRNLVRVFRRK